MITSCPGRASSRVRSLTGSPSVIRRPAWGISALGLRTIAVTVWPRKRACSVRCRPVRPVAPRMKILTCHTSNHDPTPLRLLANQLSPRLGWVRRMYDGTGPRNVTDEHKRLADRSFEESRAHLG